MIFNVLSMALATPLLRPDILVHAIRVGLIQFRQMPASITEIIHVIFDTMKAIGLTMAWRLALMVTRALVASRVPT
jgi:hypothetical protein